MKMPIGFMVFLFIFFLFSFSAIPSSRIPFIYQNQIFLIVLLAYLLLAGCASSVIFIKNHSKAIRSKSNYPAYKSTLKQLLIGSIGIYVFPLGCGFIFSLSVPLFADIFASKVQNHEYKMVGTEEFGKASFFLTKVKIIDKYNNSDNFVIGNGMLNQLNLHEGDKLLVTGRNCIAGFVIDKINGVERK